MKLYLIKLFIFLLTTNIIISMILFMINKIFHFKIFMNREKSSSYECGFDPKFNLSLPLSIKFFLIMLIFLIFDLELSFIIPLMYLFMYNNFLDPLKLLFISSFIMLILFIGLMWEMNDSSLNWI